MKSNKKISLIIPVFNEKNSIEILLKKIKQQYPEFEVIVVDDGSDDNVAEILEKFNVKVVRHPYNVGNGAAVKSGIRCATGDVVVIMDGDGQHDPNDIKKLLEYTDEYDLVIGARDRQGHASFLRYLANWFYCKLASYVTNHNIEDLTSGFRAFHRKTVKRFLYLFPNGFSYPTTSTLAYLRSGLSVKFVPIKVNKRVGQSKINPFKDGIRFLLIILKITTLFSPLKIFIPISLAFIFLGFFYYLYTYITDLRLSVVSPTLISVGIMIFLMGLISEQITQLRFDRTESDE